MKQKYKLVLNYRFDIYLMHLIQGYSKRCPADILTFFHELANQVCEIGLQNKAGRSIKKKIVDYFPNTPIPFFVVVTGYPSGNFNQTSQRYDDIEIFRCSVEIKFPEHGTYMEEDSLKEISVLLMEKALLGGDDVVLPNFEKPPIKSPKMFKSLMDAFAGRPVSESIRSRKKEDI